MSVPPHPGAGKGPKKGGYLLPLAVAAGVCAGMALAGCSSTDKHKWLAAFFDGVPAQNAGTNAVSKPAPGGAAQLAAPTNAPGGVTPAVPAPPVFPMHKPYLDNNCEACHESKYSVSMRAPLKQVCLDCHKTLLPAASKSIHSPVDSGECLGCHNPHFATNKFLLVRAGKALCGDCHDPDIAHPVSSHEPFESGECLSCHDPHASPNKHLVLRAGAKLCFDCHDDFLAKAKFKHFPAENGECESCHNPHASNFKSLLIKESSKLCEDCHEAKDIAAAKGHANIGQAACLTCHDPHIGNDEYLLKPGKAVAKGPLR